MRPSSSSPGLTAARVTAAPSLSAPRRVSPRARRWGRRLLYLALLSALLHLAVVAVLLRAKPPEQPGAVSPPSFEMVMEPGAKEGEAKAAKPTELPGLPAPSPEPRPTPPAATQAPAPPPPPPPPAPPRAQAEAAVRMPSPERTPLADLPPFQMPEPPPIPETEPEPSPSPAPTRARRRQPAFPAPMDLALNEAARDQPPTTAMHGNGALNLAIGRAARESNGAPPRDTSAAEGMITVRGGPIGKDWIEQLHEWWLQHSYYPPEAAMRAQDGTVQIHVRVDRYGHVRLVELEGTSGSLWLDAAAQAVFRDANVPPFPLATDGETRDLDITIDYILVGKGRR